MNKLLSTVLATTLAVLPLAASAQSTEHRVRIEKRGYFPQVIHVQPGDTIRFVNKSGNWARLYSENDNDNYSGYNSNDPCNTDSDGNYYFAGSRDGWSTGWISNNNSTVVTIHACTEIDLRSPYVYQYGGDNDFYRGEISFDAPYIGQPNPGQLPDLN